jgi:hypothetical protein
VPKIISYAHDMKALVEEIFGCRKVIITFIVHVLRNTSTSLHLRMDS